MPYNHLRYFWFVAHEGNLTKAAKQLHISQSALSVQIKTLSSQLGHQLFEQRGRQLILTEAGRIAVDALIERMGVRPAIAAETNDMAMLRLIAREKIGLAVVPPIVVKDELSQGVLQEIKKIPDLKETFYAVTLKRQFPNPLLNDLLEEAEIRHTSS